jgi:hypothetical protein
MHKHSSGYAEKRKYIQGKKEILSGVGLAS